MFARNFIGRPSCSFQGELTSSEAIWPPNAFAWATMQFVLDDLSASFRDQAPEGAVFVEGAGPRRCIVYPIPLDYVYHLAAYAAQDLAHFVLRHNYQTNLVGTVNLINEAIKGWE
jgi:nucleoside-diphosphate-sugar epimerase